MSRRYTNEEKDHILHILDQYRGDVVRASVHTGVPERTLFRWKQRCRIEAEHKSQQSVILPPQKSSLPPPQTDPDAPESDDEEESLADRYVALREMMLDRIFTFAEKMTDDNAYAASRAVAVTRLLDRVIKLDAEIDRINYIKANRAIFEYELPDYDDDDYPD
jgi:hypothetical protein